MVQDALAHLVRGIVNHPDDVVVRSIPDRRVELFQVRVHPDDLGRVIGRGGRTARSLRTVINAISRDRPARVEIVDTDRQR
ncbi:MAG: RNA-binding protein [Actinomycetota bacterium]